MQRTEVTSDRHPYLEPPVGVVDVVSAKHDRNLAYFSQPQFARGAICRLVRRTIRRCPNEKYVALVDGNVIDMLQASRAVLRLETRQRGAAEDAEPPQQRRRIEFLQQWPIERSACQIDGR